MIELLLYVIFGVLIAMFVSLIPALHIYNVLGIFVLIALGAGGLVPMEFLPYVFMAMVVTYAIMNTLTAVFLSAPDESMIFVLMPGHKALLRGRAYEVTMMTAAGSIMGILLLLLLAPFATSILPAVRKLVSPHLHWIIGLMGVYIIMSEWPKTHERHPPGWRRFLAAWRSPAAGLLTFLLSGFLGLIVFNKNILPLGTSFQALAPVFIGLFAVPSIIINLFAKAKIPAQKIAYSLDFTPDIAVRSTIAGGLGGLMAATFPIITAGMGALVAGQATAQQDERVFIMSQGVSKVVYYVGAYLFFFIPYSGLGKGGLVLIISPFFRSLSINQFITALAVMMISAGLAFIALTYIAKLFAIFIHKINYKLISAITLVILVSIVFVIGKMAGVFLMIVATGIGLIPVLYGARRLNCLGVLLLPISLNMAGIGPKIAHFLGII